MEVRLIARLRLAVAGGALLTLLAGCGAAGPAGSPAVTGTGQPATPPPAAATPTPSGPSVGVADNATLGKVLVNAAGMTLYVYTQDTPGKGTSTCTGGCATTWPPLVAPSSGTPQAAPGVTGALGAITRADGTKQVTMNGAPLYLYAGDTKAGEASGQAVGSVWFAVTPAGRQVGGAAAATTGTVNVADNAALGKILVNSAGMTLYLYTKDAPGFSKCSGPCATAWPPLGSGANPTAGAGVTGKLAVITRTDGRMQVTINGQPLYRYAADKNPGDATGEGVGTNWFAVKPSGAEVIAAATTGVVAAGATATAGGY